MGSEMCIRDRAARRGPREVGDGPATSREARPGQGRQGLFVPRRRRFTSPNVAVGGLRARLRAAARRRAGQQGPVHAFGDLLVGPGREGGKVILAKSIGQALGCLERCHGACKADERKRLETRHRDCEVQAFRRGAAALCACSAGIDAGDEHKHRYLDGFRKLVPGEPHSADDAFVNSLEREQGKVSLWAVAAVDGAACVVDVGDSSAYAGAVLAKASVDLSDAATVRQTLVEAMAGASDEARCLAGPPRRPRSIEFHADLETIAEALRDDLKTAFDVDVVLGKKDAVSYTHLTLPTILLV